MQLASQTKQEHNKLHSNTNPKMVSEEAPPRSATEKWQLNPNVLVTNNDGQRSSLKTLIDIKNVISQQLPKMPKNYITKIVFDERHQCLYLQQQGKVIGTACFRCFHGKNFVQLVFLAVLQIYRDNGLGSKIIDSLKQLLQTRGKKLLLTYADCTAVGFFIKQAFQFTVEDSQKQWANYIKPYDGGRLMQCRIDISFKYAKFRETLKFQQECLVKKIKKVATTDIKYQVKTIQNILKKRNAQLKFKNKENEDQKISTLPMMQEDVDLDLVPGVLDNFWSKKHQYELQNQKQASFFLQQLYALQCIRKLPSFQVSHIVQLPPAIANLMTLATVEKKINSNYYQTSHDLVKELKQMIKQWKRWCPGEADDIFYQFSKKTNVILEKLLSRKLQLKIEPMYRQQKKKLSKPTHKK